MITVIGRIVLWAISVVLIAFLLATVLNIASAVFDYKYIPTVGYTVALAIVAIGDLIRRVAIGG